MFADFRRLFEEKVFEYQAEYRRGHRSFLGYFIINECYEVFVV